MHEASSKGRGRKELEKKKREEEEQIRCIPHEVYHAYRRGGKKRRPQPSGAVDLAGRKREKTIENFSSFYRWRERGREKKPDWVAKRKERKPQLKTE